MFKIFLYLILIISSSIASSIKLNPVDFFDIQIVPEHYIPLENCLQEGTPEYYKIKLILDKIVDSNQEIFNQQIIPPETICLKMENDIPGGASATAESRQRTISVDPNKVQNNEEGYIAEAIAHELAHLVLQHSFLGDQRLVSGPEEIKEWKKKARSSISSYSAEFIVVLYDLFEMEPFKDLIDDFEPISENIIYYGIPNDSKYWEISRTITERANIAGLIDSKIYKEFKKSEYSFHLSCKMIKNELNKLYNDRKANIILTSYKETSADKLGLYMYIKAGFNPTEFLLLDVLNAQHEGFGECKSALINLHINQSFDQIPDECRELTINRFNESHYFLRNLNDGYISYYPKEVLRWVMSLRFLTTLLN